jgi:hypothetical protein
VECATQRGKRNPTSAPKALGPNGLSGEVAASVRRVGPAGPDLGEISNEKKLISNFN